MDENISAKQKLEFVLKEMRIGFANGLLLGSMAFVLLGIYIMVVKGKPWHYAFAISGCVGVFYGNGPSTCKGLSALYPLSVALSGASFVGNGAPCDGCA